MRGIGEITRGALGKIVDEMFDRIAVDLIGHIPAYKSRKTILFSSNPSRTLAHLFVQALGAQKPMPKEEEVLKNLLATTYEYVESLKSRTKAKLSESIDSYVMETRARGESPSASEIKTRIGNSLFDAAKHFKIIAESETTKSRNMGKLMNIARVGASIGQPDPSVFFVVVRDKTTCEECVRLHMCSDKITPRIWKMSELGYSYHKRGENSPKVAGLHPHCRCVLTILSPGFGFKNGKTSFIKDGHDEYRKQRG